MRIGGLQKLTLLDYPGQVACIVFTAGCNFRCPYCQNAGLLGQDAPEISEAEVVSYLEKRRGVLDGVVVTGGEPLLQPDLPDFLRRVRALGYRIKLDTNGSFPDRLAALLDAGLVDYVAVDVKQAAERYETATGAAGQTAQCVDRTLRLLARSGVPHERRTTVVRGIHTPADLEAIAKWIAGPAPYYLQPYAASEHILHPDGLGTFSAAEMEAFLCTAKRYCPNTQQRG